MKTVQPAVTSADLRPRVTVAAPALGGVTPQHTAVRLGSEQVQREKGH